MRKNTANLLGILSLIGWSLNVSVTRHIAEAHHFGMPGLSFFTAGVILICFDLARRKGLPWSSGADGRFWLLGGGAFVVYMVCYTVGLSWSESRDAVLPLGLVNYFWPALILILMPMFFPCRVKWAVLSVGIILCLMGEGAALLWGADPAAVLGSIAADWPAFILMAAAAFLWAFYTNAARKWGGEANGTGWFMVCAGCILLALWRLDGKPLGFSGAMILPFFLHAVVANAASYLFWDMGTRWGDLRMMGTLANFLPLGSVLFGAWYLESPITTGLWIGAALVVGGAVLCRFGLSAE